LPLRKALLEANTARTTGQIELQNIAEDMDDIYAVISVGPGWMIEIEGEQRSLYVERRMKGQEAELLRNDGMTITAQAVIRVAKIEMQLRRPGQTDVNYAFGEAEMGDGKALIPTTALATSRDFTRSSWQADAACQSCSRVVSEVYRCEALRVEGALSKTARASVEADPAVRRSTLPATAAHHRQTSIHGPSSVSTVA
jgi:hypothetical protein